MENKEITLEQAIVFLEMNAYEGSNAKAVLRMGDVHEVLKPIKGLIDKSAKMERHIQQLEQALDKACEELVTFNDGDFIDVKHIERWLDIRQKNGYKNARIGFKGIEEIHIVFENTFTDEERETIYDEEFYDLFVVDKICADCCYEWGCKEEKKIGTCEKCQLITKLRDKYVKSTREAKENDI